MHPTILAKRQLDAQNRIMDSAALLAERFEIEPPATVQQRNPEVAQMMRFEEIAQFLEDLALVDVPQVDALVNTILNLDGLTKTSAEVIRNHFEMSDGDPE